MVWRLEDLPPKWRQQAERQLGARNRRPVEAPEADRVAQVRGLGFVRIGSGRHAVDIPEAQRCGHDSCGDRCTQPGVWRLVFRGRAVTANQIIGEHNVAVRNGKTVAWKQWAAQAAVDAGVPRLARAGFVSTPWLRNRSGKPDPNADCLAAKFAVDGITAIGVLIDDRDDYSLGTFNEPPRYGADENHWTLTVYANPPVWRLDTGEATGEG